MKVDLRWLKRHVEVPVPAAELAEIFPRLGIPVEAVLTSGTEFPPTLVVGEIAEVAAHPNADRLQVCQVRVEEGRSRQIVCGAKNFQKGDRVPVALPGTRMPDGFRIEARPLRGILSEGMMCSARELGLADDHEGLLILQDRPAIGTPLRQLYPPEDAVLELEITANRGDLLSHRGIARELAAFFQKPLRTETYLPEPFFPESLSDTFRPRLAVSSEDAPYYILFEIRDLRVGESPAWLQRDLKAIGLRPVHNVVDITNWILFDSGQPLHAFDAARVHVDALPQETSDGGQECGGELQVRRARAGDSIVTLNHVHCASLPASTTVIADAKRVLALAGIMGGEFAAIRPETRHIFLESAYFRPEAIRRSAQLLDLRSDSSCRFERDVDPGLTLAAGQRAVQMILEICGGTFVGFRIWGQPPRGPRRIEITPSQVAETCGAPIAPGDIATHLRALGYGVDTTRSPWSVDVPGYRSDVHRPIDLVEEFLRLYGNEKIPLSPPSAPVDHRPDAPVAVYFREAADYLCHRGAVECCNCPLRPERELRPLLEEADRRQLAPDRPVSEHQSHLACSLVPGLLETLGHNLQNGQEIPDLFENGHIFLPHAGKLWEVCSTAGLYALASRSRHWEKFSAPDMRELRTVALSLARIAHIEQEPLLQAGATPAGLWRDAACWHGGELWEDGYRLQFGVIDLAYGRLRDLPYPVAAVELCCLPQHFRHKSDAVRFRAFSSYPSASRDIALRVDRSTPAESVCRQILQLAKRAAGPDFGVAGLTVFDVHEGKDLPPGQKSLALAIDFSSDTRTLGEEEVQRAFEALQRSIGRETPFEIRCSGEHRAAL